MDPLKERRSRDQDGLQDQVDAQVSAVRCYISELPQRLQTTARDRIICDWRCSTASAVGVERRASGRWPNIRLQVM